MIRTSGKFTLATILLVGACAPGGSAPAGPSSPPVAGSAPVSGTGGAAPGVGVGGGAVPGGAGGAAGGAGASAPVVPPANCNLPAGATTYTSPNYAANAALELAVRETFNTFMLPMRTAGADITTRPSAVQIRGLFDGGNPSLRSMTLPYHAGRFDQLFTLFEASAGNMYRPSEPPPATGGQLVINIYSKEGVDIRQAIEKTMFAATFYSYAVRLMSGPITPATIDRIIAVFGAHPTFGLDSTVAGTQDIWGAAYVNRRTNPRAPAPGGFYTQIKSAFIVAQAAATQGAACASVLQDAFRTIRENWEKALLATSLNYANDVKSKLAQVMVEPALHGLSEGAGFARGFLMMPATDRKITDVQLEEILTLYGQPSNGPATVYKFVTEPNVQLPKLDQIIQKIKAAYGFSDAEVETYKMTFGSAG